MDPTLNEQFHRAIMERDFDRMCHALKSGAEPDSKGECTSQFFCLSKTPVEYLINRNYPIAFLRAVVDAGAQLRRSRPGKLWAESPLRIALAAGHDRAIDLLIERTPRDEIGSEYFHACFDSKKPHLWLPKVIAAHGAPYTDLLADLLGKAICRATPATIEILLDGVVNVERLLDNKYVIEAAKKSPQGYRVFLDLVISMEPHAIDALHERGGAILHALFYGKPPRVPALQKLLDFPEIANEVHLLASGVSVMEAMLSNRLVYHLIPHVQQAGATFPAIAPDDTSISYFERVSPQVTLERLRLISPEREIEDRVMSELWASIQAQSMSVGSALPQARPSPRRF